MDAVRLSRAKAISSALPAWLLCGLAPAACEVAYEADDPKYACAKGASGCEGGSTGSSGGLSGTGGWSGSAGVSGTSGSGGTGGGGASGGGPAPSCATSGPGLSDCGPAGDEDCCSSPLVSGGTFYRSYDGVSYTDRSHPATVSDFLLDEFEVTVGRFRNW